MKAEGGGWGVGGAVNRAGNESKGADEWENKKAETG